MTAGVMNPIRAKNPIFSTITDHLRIRHFCLLGRGTVGISWMTPVVVGTAEAPVAIRTARPGPVGAGAVVVVVLNGRAVFRSRCTPDTVSTAVGLGWGTDGRAIVAAGLG